MTSLRANREAPSIGKRSLCRCCQREAAASNEKPQPVVAEAKSIANARGVGALHRLFRPSAQRESTAMASALPLVLNAVLAKTAVTGQVTAWTNCRSNRIVVVVVQRLALYHWTPWLRSCDAAFALPSTTTTESIVKPDVSRHLCLSVTGLSSKLKPTLSFERHLFIALLPRSRAFLSNGACDLRRASCIIVGGAPAQWALQAYPGYSSVGRSLATICGLSKVLQRLPHSSARKEPPPPSLFLPPSPLSPLLSPFSLPFPSSLPPPPPPIPLL